MLIPSVRFLPATLLLALCWGCWPVLVSAAGPKLPAPSQAEPKDALPSLLQRYAAAQRVALKEQVCLAAKNCVTDEARLMDALETSRRLLQAVADLAESGDPEAAYQRGMLSLDVMDKHMKRSTTDLVLRSPAQSVRLRRLISTETATAQHYLGLAAQAGHAAACRAKARHMEHRVPPSEPALVARLYLCAVRGFVLQDQRVAALEAYASMRGSVAPQAMELVEAYVLLFRSKIPDRGTLRSDPDIAADSPMQGIQ